MQGPFFDGKRKRVPNAYQTRANSRHESQPFLAHDQLIDKKAGGVTLSIPWAADAVDEAIAAVADHPRSRALGVKAVSGLLQKCCNTASGVMGCRP